MTRMLDDWLGRYIEYTENTEPHTNYHIWTGIATVAAMLKRKVWLNWGTEGLIYPNFYIALVGPPGGRKGTAMKLGKRMLHELQVDLGADCITRAALVEELANSKDTFIDESHIEQTYCALSVFSEELVVYLGEKNPDMIVTLTDLFDSPTRWAYSTKNKGKPVLTNVWLNLIGAITPSLLHGRGTAEAMGGGLTSRMIFVVADGKAKFVPFPFMTEGETRLKQLLTDDLMEIGTICGQFRFDEEALELYRRWYLDPTSARAVDDPNFRGYNERRSLHLRKLCMIMSACRTNNKTITADDFTRALSILEMTEAEMPKAFSGVGWGDHARLLDDVLLFVVTQERVDWNTLVRRFRNDATSEQLETIMKTLTDSELVKMDVGGDMSRFYTLTENYKEELS